jgi:hypothetical protein
MSINYTWLSDNKAAFCGFDKQGTATVGTERPNDNVPALGIIIRVVANGTFSFHYLDLLTKVWMSRLY